MFLTREAIMPMLSVSQESREEQPIAFRIFRPPGQALVGLQGKQFGTRIRLPTSNIPRVRFFEESPPRTDAANKPAEDTVAPQLVLWSPGPDEQEGRKEVVVDPALTRVLREHQRIGVQFLFDCLMGLKSFDGFGCILADDMGLGKTLQSVAAVWTLLTQGGTGGRPVCRKALVVCPASLVKNWGSEFDKWLGGRCKYVAVAVAGSAQVQGAFSAFKYGRDIRVLIVSYETFRGHAHEVADAGIDLVVCDEAHKLKNDHAATTRCIVSLPAKRRLLISGTPIQNNLEEFFTLVSVANPGLFGNASDFRHRVALPILRGREPTAAAEERKVGEETLAKVSELTELFILRRTNRLNARFLPPKRVLNVFVMPTPFQRRLYSIFLKSKEARKVLEDQSAKMNRTVLGTIRKLQGLVNHPSLVRSAGSQQLDQCFDDGEARAMFAEVDARDRGVRSAQRPVREELSGKLALVHQLLTVVKASGSGDRAIVISNWTQTLDLMEKMCAQNAWPVHRLDGSMAIGKRMKLVTDFNAPDNPQAYVFLLSSKAGGCGLNLIGANRLIMYDPDWNPANDHQAMARIWRDGQKKSCYIYRLFTTGTIDEKVYQRQICKDGLSTMLMTEAGEAEASEMRESLSSELVKDLFTLAEGTACATHDMIGCSRCCGGAGRTGDGRGDGPVPQAEELVEDNLGTWSHHAGVEGVEDPVLVEANFRVTKMDTGGGISFVMGCHVEHANEEPQREEQTARSEPPVSRRRAPETPTAGRASCIAVPLSEPPDKKRRWKRIMETSNQVGTSPSF